ncbi:hypothetical protein JCM2811A_40110 [Methylorubrum rhodinum]
MAGRRKAKAGQGRAPDLARRRADQRLKTTAVIPGPRSGTRNPPMMRDARFELRRRGQSWIPGSLISAPE